MILDAAEEYFVYHRTESEPGTFAADFPSAVQRPGLRAYFLLSLREDALAELDRFKPAIPSLFANSLRLDHLDRPAAREAIVGPIDRYNETAPDDDGVAIEPELVDAVLDQVASGKVDLGRAGRGVVDGGAAASRVETPSCLSSWSGSGTPSARPAPLVCGCGPSTSWAERSRS